MKLFVLFLAACGARATTMAEPTTEVAADMPKAMAATGVTGVTGMTGTTGPAANSAPFDMSSLKSVQTWLDVYRLGGSVDFDSDGKPDALVVINNDGSEDITSAGRVHTHWVSANDISETSDSDGDGTPDTSLLVAVSGTTRYTTRESDEDFDGTTDRRVTHTFDHGHYTTSLEVYRNAIDGSGKTWVRPAVSTSDIPEAAVGCADRNEPLPESTKAAGTGPTLCNGGCSFDCILPEGSKFDPIEGMTNMVFVASGAAACNKQQRDVISEALTELKGGLERLRKVNPTEHSHMMKALATTRLSFGCEYPACIPKNVVAATAPTLPDGTAMTAFSTAHSVDLPVHDVAVKATRELIFHELFHLTRGHDVNPQLGVSDPDGANRRDTIYGCARYMNNWAPRLEEFYLGDPDDASSARDAAICALADKKLKFGHGQAALSADNIFYELGTPGARAEQMMCSPDPQHVAPTAYATCGIEQYWVYCDQTPMSDKDRLSFSPLLLLDMFDCATQCPSGTSPMVACPAPVTAEQFLARVDACKPVEGAEY